MKTKKSKPIEGYKVVNEDYTVNGDCSKFGVGVKIKAKDMKRPIEDSFCNDGGVHFFTEPWQWVLRYGWGYWEPVRVFRIQVLSRKVAHRADKSVCKKLVGLEELDITDWKSHEQEWLKQASKHKDWSVRLMVVWNPHTHVSILKRLVGDEEKDVRYWARIYLEDRKKAKK